MAMFQNKRAEYVFMYTDLHLMAPAAHKAPSHRRYEARSKLKAVSSSLSAVRSPSPLHNNNPEEDYIFIISVIHVHIAWRVRAGPLFILIFGWRRTKTQDGILWVFQARAFLDFKDLDYIKGNFCVGADRISFRGVR